MKNLFTLILLVFTMQISTFAQHKGEHVVYVLAVDGQVPMSTFSGLNGVYKMNTYEGVTTYYISNFSTKEEAEAAVVKAKSLGFMTARLESAQELKELASRCCLAPTLNKFKIRNLFFDFDQAYLRQASKVELDKLISILKSNPTYTAKFHAHTDARGSLEYNVDLSKRRRDAALNYVVARGISKDRIETFVYGKDKPIAKNEIEGLDTPEGRQLNRRVEIRVKDSGAETDDVEEIAVPENLK